MPMLHAGSQGQGSLLDLATPGPITPQMVSPEIIDSTQSNIKHGDIETIKCLGERSIAGIFVQPREMVSSITKGGTMIAKSSQVACGAVASCWMSGSV